MQFFGRCRAAYVFITADIRIALDRAGTVNSLVIRNVGIAGNRRIVQIRVTGYVEVRRIRRAADRLVAFDRGRAIRRGIALRFGVSVDRGVATDRLIASRRRIALNGQVLINRRGIRDMQFFGRCRAAYVFITADIRIALDRAGTVNSLVIRNVGIAGNRRIVQIRVTGYVEVRRIRRAADRLVAFDRRGAVGRRIAFCFGVASRRLISFDRLIAIDILNKVLDGLFLLVT